MLSWGNSTCKGPEASGGRASRSRGVRGLVRLQHPVRERWDGQTGSARLWRPHWLWSHGDPMGTDTSEWWYLWVGFNLSVK